MAKENWIRVSRDRRCPVCEGADNCSVSRDGNAAWCGRVDQGSTRQNDGGQFLHDLRDRKETPTWPRRTDHRPKASTNWPSSPPKAKPLPPPKDWGCIAKEAFDINSADTARQELATMLGVDADALRRLGVGWFGVTRGWSFPERDANGKVIGINRRLVDGQKRREAGGQSGLTFDPDGWLQSSVDSVHVYLVEGGSDTAAMLSMGLSAVGRPSNLGGVELLAKLLKPLSSERIIVVIAENDRKPHDSLSLPQQKGHKPDCVGCSKCWPGWFGATRTAERLAVILGRQIAWAMPPDALKDVREWFRHFETRTDST